jgi:FkbM family methyltransferase
MLTADSLVMDLGAHIGQWSSRISAYYGCRVAAFEPVFAFYHSLSRINGVYAFHFGLAPTSSDATMNVADDASSLYSEVGAPTEIVHLVSIDEFFADHGIDRVSLMKINIEGAEFDLLDHMITTGLIAKVDNLLVQFHSFMPRAVERHLAIELALTKTHELVSRQSWEWEEWRLRG